MSQRILLIQNDPSAAIAILGALNHSNEECFEVEWVRSCSEVFLEEGSTICVCG